MLKRDEKDSRKKTNYSRRARQTGLNVATQVSTIVPVRQQTECGLPSVNL